MADQENQMSEFEQLISLPIDVLTNQYEAQHADLFPDDFLYGASSLEKYREWFKRVLLPRVQSAGEEGRLLWRAIAEVDLKKHPDILAQTLVVLSAWFFPSAQNTLAMLALLAILRKLAMAEKIEQDNGKSSEKDDS